MIGVGILGAGPVTQGIHLPTLARLTDTFTIEHIMDVSPDVAESVAKRVGAKWTSNMDELLGDPAVDVVAICSPHRYHAAQVIAACLAGKKAVLCEKPFAMTASEAEEIAAVSERTGVPIIVGAMHAYDPAWLALSDQLLSTHVHTIRSSITLPPNPRFEDFATEVVGRTNGSVERDLSDAETVAELIADGVMGLAIHDLPLIRALLGGRWNEVHVHSAEALRPSGYLIVLSIGGVHVELHALQSENWAPDWRLTAVGDQVMADIEFTPSYVQAGSGTGRVSAGGKEITFLPEDCNGYEGEWRELAVAAMGVAPRLALDVLIDDLRFALSISEKAAAFARSSNGLNA